MNVTAPQRRKLLELFNVAEAARELGMSDQRLYRDIRAAFIEPPPSPLVLLVNAPFASTTPARPLGDK